MFLIDLCLSSFMSGAIMAESSTLDENNSEVDLVDFPIRIPTVSSQHRRKKFLKL